MCSHFAYPANFTQLFARSCGSIGEFTDIQRTEDGKLAITPEMENYSFLVRRLNGEKFFQKVHPSGALLFSGFHSHLTLLQYLCIDLPRAKQPVWILSEVPKDWLEENGIMCLDETHRWKSEDTLAWLRVHGLYSVPRSIKAELWDLVYNREESRASNDPPPGL